MTNLIGERIKKLRLSANVSQEDLAKYLNISRVTIANIENGERKVKGEEIKTISDFFQVTPSYLLQESATDQVEDENRKLKELILYIAQETSNVNSFAKTALNKILYFCDFNYYEWTWTLITDKKYEKLPYWPVPKWIAKILEEMVKDGEIVIWESIFHWFNQQRIIPLRKPKLDFLDTLDKENRQTTENYKPYSDLPTPKDLIDEVLNKFKHWNANEISRWSHEDKPYKATKNIWDEIDPQLVFYRDKYFISNYHNREEDVME